MPMAFIVYEHDPEDAIFHDKLRPVPKAAMALLIQQHLHGNQGRLQIVSDRKYINAGAYITSPKQGHSMRAKIDGCLHVMAAFI